MSTIVDSPLAKVIADGGLQGEAARWLVDQFSPFIVKAQAVIDTANTIHVSDATQVSEIKAARAARLELRSIRIEADKHRKAIKEDSLRRSQCIDAAGRWINQQIEPVEARLEEMEKIAERAEAARKAALKASREALLAPYGTDTRFVNLADMPEDTFTAMLVQAKTAHEAKLAAEAKAEADRLAAENARRAEEERMRIENARLKAEAEAREAAANAERERAAAEARAAADKARKEREAIEAKAAKERAEAEAKLRAEREAREKMEREAEARRAAEAKAAKEAEDARRRAAAAPDREKLIAYAEALVAVEIPAMATMAGQNATSAFRRRVEELARSIVAEAERISK